MRKTHTVVVILEAKPGKGVELKQALMSIVGPCRAEPTCLEYRLHQSKDNPTQFILYENWESKEAHLAQFNKPYIKVVAKHIEDADLLVKPYQIYFAREL